jgi:transposase-like protein
MSQDISNLLKEATKDLLTEETLKLISEAVEKKAEEKVQLAVEAALVKQDEEYSTKLEKVLEAIDADHTAKLDKIVSRIDENHAEKFQYALNVLDESHSEKLVKIVGLYENALKSEAENFKSSLVEQLSNFIELYIDKAIPAQQIQEATENARSRKIVNEVKRLIGLSDEFVNENIKEALVDGKQQIDEANTRTAETEKQLKLVTEKAENLEKQLFLESKLVNFPSAKKTYMKRVLSEKKLQAIKENFNYVSEMFDKQEQEEVETLKESATTKSGNIDVGVAPEIVNESRSSSSADEDGSTYVASKYVSELTKKLY